MTQIECASQPLVLTRQLFDPTLVLFLLLDPDKLGPPERILEDLLALLMHIDTLRQVKVCLLLQAQLVLQVVDFAAGLRTFVEFVHRGQVARVFDHRVKSFWRQ